MNINYEVNRLINFALQNNLIDELDVVYASNLLLEVLNLDEFEEESEIEIDSNLDMQINVISHEGAIEINQLSATSRLIIPENFCFRSAKKGIANTIYYEKYGKKVESFSNDESDNYIELNGIKSELVIAIDEA